MTTARWVHPGAWVFLIDQDGRRVRLAESDADVDTFVAEHGMADVEAIDPNGTLILVRAAPPPLRVMP